MECNTHQTALSKQLEQLLVLYFYNLFNYLCKISVCNIGFFSIKSQGKLIYILTFYLSSIVMRKMVSSWVHFSVLFLSAYNLTMLIHCNPLPAHSYKLHKRNNNLIFRNYKLSKYHYKQSDKGCDFYQCLNHRNESWHSFITSNLSLNTYSKLLTDRSILASGLFGSIDLLSMFQVQSADCERNKKRSAFKSSLRIW